MIIWGKLFLVILISMQAIVTHAALPTFDSQGEKLPSLAPMLKKVDSAVVNIATYTKKQTQNPLLNDPFFRHFFNIPDNYRNQRQQRQRSAGSGVIVNAKDGLIMTNYHVIKNADEVKVSLIDGRTYQAEVMGSDPDLDISVLKIKADRLTSIKLADSNRLEVGDFVVAIGNPFGLGQTVTTGVVSAKGRTGLGIHGYENFIQTDASINPGNSGGALVNLRGELIGINTAIIAPAGGNVGIGFAIPINMAESSMKQIVKYGEVKRGQLGIVIQDITDELRSAFSLNNGQQGVLIASVEEGSTAEKAGIQSGDIVIAVDDEPTTSSGQLRSQIGVKSIGENTKLTLIRDGQQRNILVKIGDPDKITLMSKSIHPSLDGARFENNPYGKGVVVSSLEPNSKAAYSGLRSGDIIVSANRNIVNNINDFKKALGKNSNQVLLQINRNNASFYLVIR